MAGAPRARCAARRAAPWAAGLLRRSAAACRRPRRRCSTLCDGWRGDLPVLPVQRLPWAWEPGSAAERDWLRLDGRRPVIIRPSERPRAHRDWMDALVRERGSELLNCFTFRTAPGLAGRGGVQEKVAVRDVLRWAEGSRWHEARLTMDESLLSGCPEAARLFDNCLPPAVREDWFDFFPSMARPKRRALVVGGAGASSAVHGDHYAWTGTHMLCIGEKLWRFWAPGPRSEEAFGCSRSEEGFAGCAAAWRSQCDTFAAGERGLAEPAALHADYARWEAAAKAAPPLQVYQRAGETIVFPGHWWHQVLHLGVTLGVAGQYMNERNWERVMTHCVEYSGGTGAAQLRADLAALPPRERTQAWLRVAMEAKHPGRGGAMFDLVLRGDDPDSPLAAAVG
eukprot:TRINITY_DN61475_c0_g1_i1.p1 TRINITY_DN61475_c0_g1~~TRINITY_DN61475_c0_g1_i1.p1  ORF type:complete len:420 (+),score=115.90 TRINITY_DN61475_c0_g1_i1:75-1262(+)